MQDTDATGALYFANLLQIALEAFEELLYNSTFSLQGMIEDKSFLFPIVHAEADFFSPIFVGDLIEVHLTLKETGTTSFTLASDFFKKGERVGTALIVHVVYSQERKTAVPPSSEFKKLLARIYTISGK
ncbi:MAG: acyl-CoA thioesterase [Simkania negevensis]|nr:acyl-CoA thioesterase [Simkania negevensis]